MVEERVEPQGFDQATGRMMFCPSCRKPLPRPAKDQIVLVCSSCRSETSLPPPISAVEHSSIRFDAHDKELLASQAIPHSLSVSSSAKRPNLLQDDDDNFELKLAPEADRLSPAVNVAVWPSSIESDFASNKTTDRISDQESEVRLDQAKNSYNQSAGLYPRERTYPTLEAMQRLYKIFGYVSVIMAFPYVAFRFLYLLFTTKQNYLQVFAEFTEFAVPVLIGSVVITASLFAAAEGIRLAMDIQDNTLRIANSHGRRKLD